MKNSLFNNHVLKICTAVVMLSFLLIGGCFTPIDQLYGSIGINKGEWLVKFNPGNSSLLLEHSLSGARLTGELSFQVETRNKPKKWLIVASRDSITERPALLDADGNVQGYLSFTGSGDTVHISVIHRAAQSYKGTLLFKGTAQLGRQTFACRTRPNGASRVVQMASGPADSRLNDSLFDVTTDTALRLTGQMVSLLSGRDGVDSPVFDLEMAAVPQDTLYSQLTFQAKRNYYRSQYVPYYKPIDKKRCP
ncbi:MAG TPA: hypothetical protein VJC18_09930, partial [bacterium]|nr:hypothetical protein [bacterium]